MARYFQMPPRRGHAAARAPLQPLTPTDYATAAQALTAAASALTAAAEAWQSAIDAPDDTRVALARIRGITAAVDAGLALRILTERT